MLFPFERAGWVECWTVPSVVFTIDYSWHPIYPQKADEQLKQSCKCHYLFLVSMVHLGSCWDFGSRCFHLQRWTWNWTAVLCLKGMCRSLECTGIDLKPDSIPCCYISECVPVPCIKKRIQSSVHFSLSLTKWIS